MNPLVSLALFAVLPQATPQADPTLNEIRQHAAQSVGVIPPDSSWTIKGFAQQKSLWQSYEMVFDGRFRHKRKISGLLPNIDGFDGRSVWTVGTSGVPHTLSGYVRDFQRITSYVMDGAWASPNCPLTFKLLGNKPEGILLEVRCSDGDAPTQLLLDPKTYLPTKLTHWGSEGEDSWTFEDYTRQSGWAVPTHVAHRGGDESESIVVETIEHLTKSPSFRSPKIDEDAAIYDKLASKQIEFKRVAGFIFIHPKLNGRDEGWFFFDTGAEVMVIDNHVAEKLKAAQIGSESTAGVVATTQMKICRGISFQLGPITLKSPAFFEMDLTPFSAFAGIPLAGICGYDFISRGGFDIDLATNKMTIYEPGKVPLPEKASWIPFEFIMNIPCFDCSFAPNHTGKFNLDTGSMGAVDFFSPTVEKLNLLKGREVATISTGGAGGSAECKIGKIEWFEFAGHRFENMTAGFQLTKKGVFADPFIDGNLGQGVFGHGRLVFDYRKSRLAYIPGKPKAKSTK